MQLSDEVIRELMANEMSRRIDQRILNALLANAHQSSSGVDWVSFERGKSQGTYTDDTWMKDYEQPGYVYGEYREVRLKELSALDAREADE